jgi:hypothetical protein
MVKKYSLVVFMVVVLLAACSPGPTVQTLFAQLPPPHGAPLAKGTYAGTLSNSGVLIGLVVQDGLAGVYICDGKEIAEWFGGAVTDGKLNLTSPSKIHLEAVIGESISGQVTLADGRTLPFTAIAAVEGKTGLFRLVEKLNDEEQQVTGWIVTDKVQAGKMKIVRIKDGTSNIVDGSSNTTK